MNEQERQQQERERQKRYEEQQHRHNEEVRKREEEQAAQARKDRGPTCFVSSSSILTPYGDRAIANVERGDVVLSYDALTGNLTERTVVRRRDHDFAKIWEIKTSANRIIGTTPPHPFLTHRGWVRAKHVRIGDILVTASGLGQEVQESFQSSRVEPVHNLYTEGENNFVVEGCVAHNFAYLRHLRSAWCSIRCKIIKTERKELVVAMPNNQTERFVAASLTTL